CLQLHHVLSFHLSLFLSTYPAPPHISSLSLHDALPISHRFHPAHGPYGAFHAAGLDGARGARDRTAAVEHRIQESRVTGSSSSRSEEHTSELQSLTNLVCRLLLEKKKQSHTCCARYAP